MCLQLFVVPAVPNKVSPDRLSKESGLRVEKHRSPMPGSLHVSVEGGCSCSLMSDGADWNAPTWALDPKVLDGLARILRLLNDEAAGFTLQALWIGDEVETEGHVPISEVVADVLNNKLRNKHKYVVGKSAHQMKRGHRAPRFGCLIRPATHESRSRRKPARYRRLRPDVPHW